MLRRAMILLMALVMAFSVCTGAVAETVTMDQDPFECWRGHIGNIAFALPGMPTARIEEEDIEEWWTGSIQLSGNCVVDGAEYQLRSADIARWMESFSKDYPDADPKQVKYNSLFNFAAMVVRSYDGEISMPEVDDDQEMLTFTYTYPDDPDGTYQAKCLLDGTRAVCLLMEDCDHTEEAMSRLVRMTEEELEAWYEREQMYWLDFYGLELVFPHEPTVSESESLTSAHCFAGDFTRMIAQYLNYSFGIGLDEPEEAEELMKGLAERATMIVGGGEMLDGNLSEDGNHWIYDFSFIMNHDFSEYWPEDFTWIGRVYGGEDGIWYILCDDTDNGRIFMNNVGKTTQVSFESLIRMEGEILEAEPRKADGSPATLKQFCKDFTALVQAGEEDGMINLDDVMLGDAFWSDGKWVRAMMCARTDACCMTLYLSSDSEDAVVNEIHMITSDELPDNVFTTLASCCAQAAEGAEDPALITLRKDGIDGSFVWKGGRYEAEQSHVEKGSTPYRLMTIKALEPADLEHVPGEWGEDQFFAVPACTVNQFIEKWNNRDSNLFDGMYELHEIQTVPMDDGNYIHMLGFGDATIVVLTTESDQEDVGIIQAKAFNMRDNAPEAYLAGGLALATLTDMPDEQYMLLTMILHEHPLWSDLIEMLPIAGWNGKLFVVGENQIDDETYMPAAYLMDLPEGK